MKIDLSETANNAMLDALGALMGGGAIELMADGATVAVLRLSNPATIAAIAGELEFADIAGGVAIGQGTINSARIRGGDGGEILICDVGDTNSNAVIKLKGTNKIYRDQPIQLLSFRLVMP